MSRATARKAYRNVLPDSVVNFSLSPTLRLIHSTFFAKRSTKENEGTILRFLHQHISALNQKEAKYLRLGRDSANQCQARA